MGLGQLLEKLESRFRQKPGVQPLGILTGEQRTILRRDVDRMTAVVNLQKLEGFTVLEEVIAEAIEGRTAALIASEPHRFRGPRGLEEKGIVLGMRQARPSSLVLIVAERGAQAQRLLHQDDELRRAVTDAGPATRT